MVAESSAIAAFADGSVSLMTNDSFGSTVVSPMMVTLKALLVCPAGIVTMVTAIAV